MRAFHQMLTNRPARSHHQIEQPLGNILPRDNLCQCHGRGRGQVGRFPDDRVAKGQRRGDFPACCGSRKIPRRDNRNDAHRFTAYINLDTIARRIGCFTHLTQHLGGVIGKKLTGTIDLAFAFRERLALFARQKRAQFFRARHHFCTNCVQHILLALKTIGRPFRLCAARRLKRLIRLRRTGLGIIADQISDIRGVTVFNNVRACHPVAGNIIVMCLSHVRLSFCYATALVQLSYIGHSFKFQSNAKKLNLFQKF